VSYFTVIREAGPAWDNEKGVFGQPAVNEHAAYMDALAGQGLFCSPGRWQVAITGASAFCSSRTRTVKPRSAPASPAPWQRANRVVTVSVEPWNLGMVALNAAKDGANPP
jgi:hypothetical protein